jgi:hypothetical protein
MVLRRIFESKRDEVTEGWRKLHNEELHNLYPSVTEGWRKLHNEELHNLYPSPSIIRMISQVGAGHVAQMGEEECI